MNKPFPRSIVAHSALTDAERAGLAEIDEETLSRSAYLGLLALVESIIADRVPGLHFQHQIARSSGSVEGAALCRSLLHPENGFSADHIGKGRTWLAHPGPPLPALLKFFLKLRADMRLHQLTTAQQAIINRFDLTPTNPR